MNDRKQERIKFYETLLKEMETENKLSWKLFFNELLFRYSIEFLNALGKYIQNDAPILQASSHVFISLSLVK